MHICNLEGSNLYLRLHSIETALSYVRKTREPTTFLNLIFLEEVSLIRQAKREHHPIVAKFSGKAFINLDEEYLFLALQDQIIDELINNTPLLKPFIEEAIETFKFIP